MINIQTTHLSLFFQIFIGMCFWPIKLHLFTLAKMLSRSHPRYSCHSKPTINQSPSWLKELYKSKTSSRCIYNLFLHPVPSMFSYPLSSFSYFEIKNFLPITLENQEFCHYNFKMELKLPTRFHKYMQEVSYMINYCYKCCNCSPVFCHQLICSADHSYCEFIVFSCSVLNY